MRLQKEMGLTYVFITHDIATVEAIADEIVVMWKGKVVEQGIKDDIMSPPYPEYTQLLLSSVPTMDPGWLKGAVAARKDMAIADQTGEA
jgi:peptide/nickel transport system ATP-binding protein